MWTVYFEFGFHSIRRYTEEEFEEIKEFYHLYKTDDGKYKNKRGNIYAWKENGHE